MKILSARNDFYCAVLEPYHQGDLQLLYDAKHTLYTDDNPDVNECREGILSAMHKSGPTYFEDMFINPNYDAFVLFNKEHQIIGSADLLYSKKMNSAMMCGSHVLSTHRGQRLVDLLFEARERHVLTQTFFRALHLEVDHDNLASQKAAIRNGFKPAKNFRDEFMLFEKSL